MTDSGRGGGDLPTGTLTFLFTDIEGSTRIVQSLGDRYPDVLQEHRSVIEMAIDGAGGRIFGTEGDAVFAVFERAGPALAAAAEAQRQLATHAWPAEGRIRVRIGVHTGPAERLGQDYVGLTLHQVARIAATGAGGQVIVSAATRALAADELPAGLELRDLGDHRLKDLAHAERLYQLAGPGLETTFAALRTLDSRPNNLPVQVTTFIGREEIDRGRVLLETSRLLTLTGPGGTGKTRLALQLAAESSDRYPGGVYFVPLDAVTDPDLIPSAIVGAVRLDPGSIPPLEFLIATLPGKPILWVLDNLEQIIEGAPLIARLLAGLPELTILATSRIPLRIAGEQEFPVPPLALPATDAGAPSTDVAARSEAVRLFVERAMAAQPSFALTDENARDVIEIVRGLDGLPLAIELAAARVRTLPLAALRSRLDHSLAMLVGGPRDRPGRQQTLRGAIEWSHDLLDDPSRTLFRRVGVFAGGFELPECEVVAGSAADVGGDVLDGLTGLADQSLIRPAPVAEEPRYQMLVTIREFALERLAASGEEEAVRRRHAEGQLALVERLMDRLMGRGGGALLDQLERANDDLRAAIDWAIETAEPDIALRFLAGLWRFWQIRGHLIEAEAAADRILAIPGADDADPGLLARAHGARGGIAYWRGDFATTGTFYQRALEEARRSGDRRILADALYNAGYTPFAAAPDPESMYRFSGPYFEEAAALYRELGDQRGLASVEWGLGTGATYVHHWDDATEHMERALEGYRAAGDRFGEGWALHMAGLIRTQAGDPATGDRLFREALEVFAPAGDISALLILLVDLATSAEHLGDPRRAALLGGAADGLRSRSGRDIMLATGSAIGWPVPTPPTGPDDPKAPWWAAGEKLSYDEALATAREPTVPSSLT